MTEGPKGMNGEAVALLAQAVNEGRCQGVEWDGNFDGWTMGLLVAVRAGMVQPAQLTSVYGVSGAERMIEDYGKGLVSGAIEVDEALMGKGMGEVAFFAEVLTQIE